MLQYQTGRITVIQIIIYCLLLALSGTISAGHGRMRHTYIIQKRRHGNCVATGRIAYTLQVQGSENGVSCQPKSEILVVYKLSSSRLCSYDNCTITHVCTV